MQSKVARRMLRKLFAPFDGYVVHLSSNSGTQMVKEGDSHLHDCPRNQRSCRPDLAGWKRCAAGIAAGRHVRLQFEGWPAIQFAGWPSVAVGTFGGTVASVDMVDDGKGKFRCQILPDDSDNESLAGRSISCDRACGPTAGFFWNRCHCGSKSGENSTDSRRPWMLNHQCTR
jgi:hypothetical protein